LYHQLASATVVGETAVDLDRLRRAPDLRHRKSEADSVHSMQRAVVQLSTAAVEAALIAMVERAKGLSLPVSESLESLAAAGMHAQSTSIAC
jgi:hypothetical protein